MSKVIVFLQARVSSSRLPGKVLLPILGEPMLFRQIERIKKSKKIDQIVVVTSTETSDELLVQNCKSRNIDCFRGSLDDVLDRYYQAATFYGALHVVRLTGDCPLIDPSVLDQLIELHLNGNFDYSSNGGAIPTFPDGLDAEIMKFETLKSAWQNSKLKSEREHVTPYIYKEIPSRPSFKIGTLKNDTNLSSLRWTVDEKNDFEFVTSVYEYLYPKNQNFLMNDILTLLKEKPELAQINSGIQRNEGYLKSLKAD